MNKTQVAILKSLSIAALFVMTKPQTLIEVFSGLTLFFIAMFADPLFLNYAPVEEAE